MNDAAQNQHYVPKFVLRNFLSNPRKESVTVYDKKNDSIFTTSIRNIMAERRFHDLRLDQYQASFEPAAGELEKLAIPSYRSVLAKRSLELTVDERASLSLFLAFQFVRTRAHRDLWKGMAETLRDKIVKLGLSPEDIDGFIEPTDEEAKTQHLLNIPYYIREFAPHFAEKNWQLLLAPKKRKFYLSDNPVVLHNELNFGPYGNLGIAVPGIQIFLPLSSEVVLCALCPSIVEGARTEWRTRMEEQISTLGKALSEGSITISQGIQIRQELNRLDLEAGIKIASLDDGGTIRANSENVDFINSLQTRNATRFVVCQKGDLDLARRYNREFPQYRAGVKVQVY